jgi:hypothetical protein
MRRNRAMRDSNPVFGFLRLLEKGREAIALMIKLLVDAAEL